MQNRSVLIFVISMFVLSFSVSGAPKDVVFIVEASNNVNQEEFNKTIDFIDDVITHISIGPNDTQVSVISFNSAVMDHFTLNNCTERVCLQTSLEHIKSTIVSTEDSTKTDDALAHVEQTTLTSENGDRPGAENLIFLILYGSSDAPINTILSAGNLKGAFSDLTLYAVGVGTFWQTDSGELNGIASDSSTVLQISSASEFCGSVPTITKIIGDIDVSDTCVTTTTITTTDTTTDTETTTTATSSATTALRVASKDSSGDAAIIAGVALACTILVGIAAVIIFAKTKIKEKCKITTQSDHQHVYIVQQYPDAVLGEKNCKFKR